MINVDASMIITDGKPLETKLIPQDKWWKVNERAQLKQKYLDDLERKRKEEWEKQVKEAMAQQAIEDKMLEDYSARKDFEASISPVDGYSQQYKPEKVEVVTTVDLSKPGVSTSSTIGGVNKNFGMGTPTMKDAADKALARKGTKSTTTATTFDRKKK
jgi:hypothetical protein